MRIIKSNLFNDAHKSFIICSFIRRFVRSYILVFLGVAETNSGL